MSMEEDAMFVAYWLGSGDDMENVPFVEGDNGHPSVVLFGMVQRYKNEMVCGCHGAKGTMTRREKPCRYSCQMCVDGKQIKTDVAMRGEMPSRGMLRKLGEYFLNCGVSVDVDSHQVRVDFGALVATPVLTRKTKGVTSGVMSGVTMGGVMRGVMNVTPMNEKRVMSETPVSAVSDLKNWLKTFKI